MIYIAEIGINHDGDMVKAKRMASKALDCGATYVKFQYYSPEKVLGRDHPALQYAKQCYFSRMEHEELRKYVGPQYMVSVFNVGDVGWADTLCSAHKIASRMNTSQEFISKIEQTKKPVFMSIQPGLGVRIPKRFNLLWCVREYPAVKEDILKYPYDGFGLSSHCPDWKATKEAIELGATVVENHICESRQEEGCDKSSSLTLEEYEKLIVSTSLETIRR